VVAEHDGDGSCNMMIMNYISTHKPLKKLRKHLQWHLSDGNLANFELVHKSNSK